MQKIDDFKVFTFASLIKEYIKNPVVLGKTNMYPCAHDYVTSRFLSMFPHDYVTGLSNFRIDLHSIQEFKLEMNWFSLLDVEME